MAHFRGEFGDPWRKLAPRSTRVGKCLAVSWRVFVMAEELEEACLKIMEGRLFALYKEFGEIDALTAKSLVLLHGLRLCSLEYSGRLLVEVDSESLVSLVNSGRIPKWPLCNFLRRIRALLEDL